MKPEHPEPFAGRRLPNPEAGSGEPPEFEDEPPGAYLSELSVGSGAAAWSLALFLLTAALAVLGFFLGRGEALPAGADHGVRLPLDVAWRLLPGAAIAGFLIILFVRLVGVPRSRRAARMSIWLHLAALIAWAAARWGFGIGFLPPE